AAFTSLGGQYLIFEERIGFAAETSVILVRGRGGGIKTYPTTSNAHENGILRQTSFPSPLSGPLEQAAFAHAAALADALDYVGVLAVEFFVTSGAEPSLIANEMAPRVHNTGHWTMDGAVTSQFENHIRAIAGWPLGSVVLVGNVTMRNLLGDEALKCDEHLLTAGAKLHLYGKAAPKPGRKMGHVNFIV
ncbi:MAG: ATP-grasp domain-containing protein, partial [Pseudomonadota bacterium]